MLRKRIAADAAKLVRDNRVTESSRPGRRDRRAVQRLQLRRTARRPRTLDQRRRGEQRAGAVADAARMFGNPAYAEGLRQLAARALAALPSLPAVAGAIGDVVRAGSPAAAFFGTLFFPAPRHLDASDGTLPDAPDYSYHFDQEAGHLTVTRTLDDGTSETVFDGRYDKSGVFRDADGDAVGRFLGDSVALDADAIRGYEARRRSDAAAPPGTIAQTTATTRSDPKLCPDPTVESIAGRKAPALLYQSQISGLPPRFDFRLPNPAGGKPVSFDACWENKNGTIGDAKGPGYAKFMIAPDGWFGWYEGDEDIEDQMARQSRAAAAAGRRVEWHFAEQGPAEYFKKYVNDNRADLPNIDVYYTPPANQP